MYYVKLSHKGSFKHKIPESSIIASILRDLKLTASVDLLDIFSFQSIYLKSFSSLV